MTLDDAVTEVGRENPFFEEAELAQVLKHMDDDRVDESSQMSQIDFNSRLTRNEIGASLVCDELVRIGVLPDTIGISRQKKRLSVSLEGKGREEKVRIVSADREATKGTGFGAGLKALFTPKRD